jgi:hypothetical protein
MQGWIFNDMIAAAATLNALVSYNMWQMHVQFNAAVAAATAIDIAAVVFCCSVGIGVRQSSL